MKFFSCVAFLSFANAIADADLAGETHGNKQNVNGSKTNGPISMNKVVREFIDGDIHSKDTTKRNLNRFDEEPRIVNGVEVSPKFKYEFMINAFGCGASLVAPNVAISAAHCGNLDVIQIGRHDLDDASESYEEFSVIERVPHPQYNSRTEENDFMMLRLNGSSSRTPVVLDSDLSLDSGRDVIAMGWGHTSYGGVPSSVLLEVELDLLSNSECENRYDRIPDVMVCATRSGKDSCQGDSGGPLIDKATGKLIGIVSWGADCADPFYPGVYAKVQHEIDWINQYIALWNVQTPPPAQQPTLAPTPAPSPVTPPTTSCSDSTSIFQITKPDGAIKNKSCEWVARKSTSWRCFKVTGAAENCPLTCNNCGIDTTETFTLLFNQQEKDCFWAAVNPVQRCKKSPTRMLCGASCNGF